ncbi:hypothetical protein HQN90_20310 [Paenibacillus alba]|nr:hypothetical protein [Paenibacillus alba]
MVAEIETDQFSLFPIATQKDIERTKVNLTDFIKMKQAVINFERNPPVSEKQLQYYQTWVKVCSNLERAVGQILEQDVREITEYRFIKGFSRAATILRFSGWNYCDKTIDRKIFEGITSVANTLLYLE